VKHVIWTCVRKQGPDEDPRIQDPRYAVTDAWSAVSRVSKLPTWTRGPAVRQSATLLESRVSGAELSKVSHVVAFYDLDPEVILVVVHGMVQCQQLLLPDVVIMSISRVLLLHPCLLL